MTGSRSGRNAGDTGRSSEPASPRRLSIGAPQLRMGVHLIEGFDAFGAGDVAARFRHRSRPPVPIAVNGLPIRFIIGSIFWSW